MISFAANDWTDTVAFCRYIRLSRYVITDSHLIISSELEMTVDKENDAVWKIPFYILLQKKKKNV